jgi:hypothetical protein
MSLESTRRKHAVTCALSAVLALGAVASQYTPACAQAAPISEQEAHAIAVDAYIYFYPLMSMDVSRKQASGASCGPTSILYIPSRGWT